MNRNILRNGLTVLVAILIVVSFGCSKKEEAPPVSPDQKTQKAQPEPLLGMDKALTTPALETSQMDLQNVAVSVDGVILKKDVLARSVQAKLKLLKDKIPADKKKKAQAGIKKQTMDDFVMRTLLTNEANNKNVKATDKEIQAAVNQIKANLPPDKKLEDFLKENQISREDIALGIKIKKLIDMEKGGKIKPTQKEISKFYQDNKDKLMTQDAVHVRHILITFDAKDDEKIKAEKKAKIDNLRKQLLEGADFAEIAKNNSDCPSKENGGDLGEIKKGQTIKAFEDAAFTQEKDAIGPVVTTEYGHHIIQVLERKPGSAVKLDEVKDKIAQYLEQQKQAEAFARMTARLKKNAVIIYNEK